MTFSRQIVSVVAASVLVMHVVLGCCAHHGHAHAIGSGAGIACRASHADDHGCRACAHHSADSPAPDSSGEPQNDSCGEGACSFLAASKIVLPDLTQTTGVVATAGDALRSQLTLQSATPHPSGEELIVPSLRSHLSKHVLLV